MAILPLTYFCIFCCLLALCQGILPPHCNCICTNGFVVGYCNVASFKVSCFFHISWENIILLIFKQAGSLSFQRCFTLDTNYDVYWNISGDDVIIALQMRANDGGWFGFGIAGNGGMRGADIALARYINNIISFVILL